MLNLQFWDNSGCFLFSDEAIWIHQWPVAFVGQPLFMPPSWVVLVGHKALFGRLSGAKDAETRVHQGIPRQRHASLSHHRGVLNAGIQLGTMMQFLRLVPHAAREWAAQNSKGQHRPFPERRYSSGIKSWNAIHQRTFRKAEDLGFDVAIKNQLGKTCRTWDIWYYLVISVIWGFPLMWDPLWRWMVDVMENPKLKWMMTGGTPMKKRKPPYLQLFIPMVFHWIQDTSWKQHTTNSRSGSTSGPCWRRLPSGERTVCYGKCQPFYRQINCKWAMFNNYVKLQEGIRFSNSSIYWVVAPIQTGIETTHPKTTSQNWTMALTSS